MVAGNGAQTRIAIDARLAGGSSTGDSTYWGGLLRGFAEVGPDFHFLLFSNAPRPLEIPDSELFEWRTVKGSGKLWSLLHLPLAIRRARANLFHTQYNFSPLTSTPTVTTIHDVSFFIGPQWFQPRDRAILQRFVPASAGRARRVITVSETSKSEIQKWIPAAHGKVRVTHPDGHHSICRMPRETAKKMVEQKLSLSGPYLLTVGTRWPRKNTALAIHAADLLPAGFPHSMVVTGKEGWGEEGQGKRRKATGYVDFTLLSALYSAADLYLSPSRHEGFGMTVVEAMRCGCPVLSSSGGALPETLGGAGSLCESDEPSDWATSIESLLGDLSNLESMRERGLRRAADFSWKQTALKTIEVYLEALR